MTTSALRMMLTHTPDQAEIIRLSIERGELRVGDTFQKDPLLFHDFALATLNSCGATKDQRKRHLQDQFKLAILLAEHGAKPWITRPDGQSTFSIAIRIGNADLLEWLGKHPDAPSDLCSHKPGEQYSTSYFNGANAATTKALLDLGFDPHVRMSDGSTLLHSAKNAEVLDLLLSVGVDPALKNNQGKDAKTHWDGKHLRNDIMAEVDAVFARHLPADHNSMIREFGKQWVEVGPTICRQRLKDAEIDPASAEIDGIGLIERVVGYALQSSMKKPDTSGWNTSSMGDPLSHRKWRRLVLSIIRTCQFDPKVSAAEQMRIRDALELYQSCDHLFVGAAKTVSRVGAGANKKLQTKVDETFEQLAQAIGSHRFTRPTEKIEAGLAVIDRLTRAGVIDNAAVVAGWLMRIHMPAVSGDEWMKRDATGEMLFLRLTKIATAEFDPVLYGAKTTLGPATVGYAGVSLGREIPVEIAMEKNAMGVIAILAAQTRQLSCALWLTRRLEQVAHLPLEPGDPWLAHGIALLNASKESTHHAIARELEVGVMANALHMETPHAPVARATPRL